MADDVASSEAVEDDAKVEPATLAELLEEKDAAEQTVVVTLRGGKQRSLTVHSIGREAFRKLIARHPPGETDVDGIGLPLRWSPGTFEPALVAASLTEPVLSEAEVSQIFESKAWSKGDLDRLVKAALDVNETSSTVEAVGKG